uniref:Ribosomal protein S11 n=1 Tax=Periphykon beckeri TaxID=2006982 RepID=UPI0022FD92F3|nr:Ribosomal protein S11 [Periphykon beckeri]WAX04144.1 Ribosomal protein S11 [Periphykon beckeri]
MKICFLFILFTQNNIFLTFTNFKGQVLNWYSVGRFKSKGLKKLTVSLIKTFLQSFIKVKLFKNIRFHIKLKGHNKLKKQFIKIFLKTITLENLSISDNSKFPTNGCKLKRKRRL